MNKLVTAILAGVVLCYVAAAYSFQPSRDPFDKFEVVSVETSSPSKRYAVTYRYHHANSSQNLHAIWQLSNQPNIGSSTPPPGQSGPIVAWTESNVVLHKKWVG
ncbi:MAG: hypothetical protein AAFO79_06905, partial [Pseudomonadota bacterium]